MSTNYLKLKSKIQDYLKLQSKILDYLTSIKDPTVFPHTICTNFFSLIMHQSFYFTCSCIFSQIQVFPLLHQIPQQVQQYSSSDYSGRVWTKTSSQSKTHHGPPIFGSSISCPESWFVLLRRHLWGKVTVPAPEPNCIPAQSHYHGSTKVLAHIQKILASSMATCKRQSPSNQRRRLDKTLKVPDDCKKESVQLAHSLHSQEMKNIFNSYKK
jgi:hypothetical protein